MSFVIIMYSVVDNFTNYHKLNFENTYIKSLRNIFSTFSFKPGLISGILIVFIF